MEILGAGENTDFDAHEVNGQIAAVEFRESDGVFLGGDDALGLSFLAAVDGVEDFLLGVTVMIGEAFGVNELGAEVDEAGFEALGLGDAAEGGDPAPLEQGQALAFGGEDVLEVKGMMDAFDDAGVGIAAGDAFAQALGLAIAFGDEDGVGAGEVCWRLAQGAPREHVLVAKRLLTVDEHDIHAAAPKFPVLESIVEQQGVAAELFDGVPAAFDPVFVYEHHDVAEVAGEHEGFVASGLRIEQERTAVGDHPRRGAFLAEQEFV